MIDFYANTTNGTPLIYFDNVIFSQLDPVNCNNIGLVGTFNEWGNTGPDSIMTQDESHPYKWYTDFELTEFSEIKFRQNEDWNVNWGGEGFPSGYGYQDGPNIQVPANNYNVYFNCETGDYIFESGDDRTALMAIYNAAGGDDWNNNDGWGANVPLSEWHGVETDGDGNVTALFLGNNNLIGTIAPEIGNLTHLEVIIMSGNQLSGSIPAGTGNLTNCWRLSLSQNQLSGSIPAEIGNMLGLTWLALWQNNLSGEIPAEFWAMSQLEYIWMGTNPELSGSISSDIGNMTNLIVLWIDGTQLSGNIPPQIGNLTQLEQLKLQNNNMESYLPEEIAYLSNLKELNLSGNDFYGELPEFLSTDSLNYVLVSNNRIDNIQDGWASVNIDSLNIEGNKLTFEDLYNLPANAVYDPQKEIAIYDTAYLEAGITGTIQLSFDHGVSNSTYSWYREGEFMSTTSGNSILATEGNVGTVVFSLEISNTDFPGFTLNIDSVIVITEDLDPQKAALMALYEATNGDNWTDNTNWNSNEPLNDWFGVTADENDNVTKIVMTNNNLVGELPSEIGNLNHLTQFRLDGHDLTGTIPNELYSLQNLTSINLSNNDLDGEISPLLGNLSSLTSLFLYNNNFTGIIPPELANCTALTLIDIGANDLTGTIPSEFINLQNLNIIDVSSSDLSGDFPDVLLELPNLTRISMGGCEFEGELPSEIGDLMGLTWIDVTSNNFVGAVPSTMANLPNLTHFYFHYNEFDLFPNEFSYLTGVTGNGSNNHFTFEDLENFPADFNYNPQREIPIVDTLELIPNQPQSYQLDFDLTVVGSSYQWYRNNVLFEETTSGTIEIDEAPDGQTHYYHVEITNSSFPGFTLITEPLVVLTENCNVSFTYESTDIGCNAYDDGTITISASGGEEPYEYSMDDGTSYQSQNIFENLAEGEYYLMVKDAIGCESEFQIAIISEPEVINVEEQVTDVICAGYADGVIDLSVSGGVLPYSYSWIGPNDFTSTNEDISGLIAGQYDLVLYDANGCEFIETYFVSEPEVISVSELISNVGCYGEFTGSIDITPSGGILPYTFDWSGPNSFNASSEDINGLEAGQYDLTFYDANGCEYIDSYIVAQPDEIVVLETITDLSCNGELTGAISIDISGGTPSYNIEWFGPNDFFSPDQNISALEAGEYNLIINDENYCQYNNSYIVTEPNLLSFAATPTDVLCSGNASGEIDFVASGGTPPYEYSIDNGSTWQTTALYTGLAAGDYEVAVRDANACQSGDLVTINEPADILSFTATPTDILCSGDASGEIDFAVSGGTPPYEYSIDNGSTWQTTALYTGLAAGDYEVAVRDANACQLGDLVTINEPLDPVSFIASPTDVLCVGEANGEINFVVNGGTPAYEYSIDNGANWQSSSLFTDLTAGDYDVAVRDANTCISYDLITINEPVSVLEFTTEITDVLCSGDINGEINILATGGTVPYEFSIDNGETYLSMNIFTGLSSGDYDVIVRDANLCTAFNTETISEPADALAYTANVTNVMCFGGSDGEIEILATGGTAPYEYSIDGGENWQSSAVFTALSAGEYSIVVIDANLCEANGTESISEPESLPEVNFSGLDAAYCENASSVVLTGNQAPDGSFSGPGITDNGDGTAEFDPLVAGVGGPYEITYSYTDTDGCSNFETQETSVSALDIISFSGLDSDYCVNAASATLIGSEAPEGSFSGPGITDNGDGTAVFNPAIAGAGGPFQIVYEFTNTSGCTSQTSDQTTVNELPTVEFSGLDAAYCDGDASVTLTGNFAPEGSFSGLGITDNGDGTAIFDPMTPGIGGPYDIIYSYADALGCSNSQTQQTSVFDLPMVSFTGLEPDYCEGSAEVLITGSEAPNGSFSGPGVFDQGNGTAYFYPVITGIGGPYEITYSYENGSGCIGESAQQTNVNPIPLVSFTGLDADYCLNDDAVTLTGSEAPEGSFSGSGITDNGDGTANFDPAIAGAGGNYEIIYTYTSPDGCIGEEVQETFIYLIEPVTFSGLDESYCSDASFVELIGSEAPSGNFSGTGVTDNGDGTATFDPQLAGVGGPYSIIYEFTNANACYEMNEQTTEIFEMPVVSFTGLDTAYCEDAAAVTLTANYSGGSFTGPGITDNGNGTAIFNPSAAGAGEDLEIVYFYESPEGCSDESIQYVDVISYSVLSFTDLDEEICASDLPYTLIGNLAPEGSFNGSGITDNGDGTAVFDPDAAGAGGPYEITYEFLTAGMCLSSTSQEVTVLPFIELSFSGLDTEYCNEDVDVLLTGSEAPNGFFTGPGIDNNGDGTATFNPSVAGVGGPHIISYYVSNAGGCNDVGREQTQVLENPISDFVFNLGGCAEDAIFTDMSTSANGNIVSWNWSFDDPDSDLNNTSDLQNPSHQFVSNKSTFTIELQIEDEFGCSASNEKLVQPYSSTTITGTVMSDEGEIVSSGYVLGFLLSDGQISTQVDSVIIQNDGSFMFDNMATCVEYIFHAYCDKLEYPNLFTRWHYDAFYWFNATPVSVEWEDELVEGIDISLYTINPPPAGNSSVGGGVYYYDSKGEPVKNVDVVLEYDAPADKADEVVGHEPTNELGQWEFEGLGEGSFKIKVDIPGLEMDSVYQIIISEPNTHIYDLNYYLDPDLGIFTDQTGIDELNTPGFVDIELFPNPNSGIFNLELVKTNQVNRLNIESVELYDLEGRMVKDLGIQFVGHHYYGRINLKDVDPGMYFIKINNGDASAIAKVVVQR